MQAHVLTAQKALHVRATRTFTNDAGKERQAGEEWLVTSADAPTFIADVHEEVIREVGVHALTVHQYCVVVDPFDARAKKVRLGQKELRKGPSTFFLHPGEKLEDGIQGKTREKE